MKDPRHGDPRYGESSSKSASLKSYTPDGRKSGVSINSVDPVMYRSSGVVMRSSSHMAFDNPYYDVMAAMSIDDDMADEFSNPLYGQNLSAVS